MKSLKVLVKNQNFLFILSLASIVILLFFFLPKGGHGGDLAYWIRWSNWIKELGLNYVYTIKEVNYFPIYIFMLFLFGLFVKEATLSIQKMYFIKFFIFLFDIGSVLFIGRLLIKLKKSPFLSYLILFNPAFFYGSLVWGQIESIYIFFLIASLVSALLKRPNMSVLFFVLSFYSKLQAIIFIPSLFILILPEYFKNKRNIFKTMILVIFIHLLLLAPFIGNIQNMYQNVFSSFSLFPVISSNAFNFWYLILSGAKTGESDTQKFLFLTYKMWGILLFCITSIFILLPLIIDVMKNEARKNKVLFFRTVFLVNGLVSFAFFFFNTQMHERYLQPTIALLGVACILRLSKSGILNYFFVSVLFFLNLERVLNYFPHPGLTVWLFKSRPISLGYTVAIVWCLYELYRYRNLQEDWKYIKGLLPHS